MLTQVFSLGGDTDTIGAMAGAIWGAFNGRAAIDKNKIRNTENTAKIIGIAEQLHSIANNNAISSESNTPRLESGVMDP